jgi:hypothetical protein
MPEITLHHTENPVQQRIRALVAACAFCVLIIHRAGGKTRQGIVEGILRATQYADPPPRVAYISEQLVMSRRNAWDYAKHFAGMIPGAKPNETLLTVDFAHNGGRLSLFGADTPDTLRGLHHDFVILDEFALMKEETWPEVVLPTLLARNGGALLMGTVLTRRDPLWVMYQKAATLEGWGRLLIRASESGVLSPEQLTRARAVQTAEQYAREYECVPLDASAGTIYGPLLDALEREGRLTVHPWDPRLPVFTAWDLGIRDATSILFFQRHGTGWAVIDVHHAAGLALADHIRVVKSKPYSYARHVGPHDVEMTEYTSGVTRWETARSLGIHFDVAPRLSVAEGIDAVRMLLPRLWIDTGHGAPLVEALSGYHYEWSADLRMFSQKPVHDAHSHLCDALRYFAVTDPDRLDAPLPADYQRVALMKFSLFDHGSAGDAHHAETAFRLFPGH